MLNQMLRSQNSWTTAEKSGEEIKTFCETPLHLQEENTAILSSQISLHDTILNNFLKAFVG